MQEIGKWLVVLGLTLTLIGVVLWRAAGYLGWFGKLPGDFAVHRSNFSFYFPITTCLLLSLLLTLISWLLRR